MLKKTLLCACLGVGLAMPAQMYAGEHLGTPTREFNGTYQGKNLDYVAFPIGGMGAGMFCLEGTGAISHVSLKNRPDLGNEPYVFAAISVKGYENGAKVLEGPVPDWKIFGLPGRGFGSGEKTYGFPRFENAVFQARFPFATIDLQDNDVPLVHCSPWVERVIPFPRHGFLLDRAEETGRGIRRYYRVDTLRTSESSPRPIRDSIMDIIALKGTEPLPAGAAVGRYSFS